MTPTTLTDDDLRYKQAQIKVILKGEGFSVRFYTHQARRRPRPTVIAVIKHDDSARYYLGTLRKLARLDKEELVSRAYRVLARHAQEAANALSIEAIKAICAGYGYAAWVANSHGYGGYIIVQAGKTQRYLGTARVLAADEGRALKASLEALREEATRG